MAVLSINSNIFSQRATRALDTASQNLSQNINRLSSGLRINTASDDSAGLAVGLGLSTGTRVYTQGIRNVNDGVSLLNVAEGALTQLNDILVRQKELAMQAANGSLSRVQRLSIDDEAAALSDEFNRITASTKFNDLSILSGSFMNLNLQLGFGTSEMISSPLGQSLSRTIGDGSFQANQTYAGSASNTDMQILDINSDGNLDVISVVSTLTAVTVALGNGDGTFVATVSYRNTGAQQEGVTFKDINNDGKLDMLTTGFGKYYFFSGNGDGTFNASVSYSNGIASQSNYITPIVSLDLNSDGRLDLLTAGVNGIGFALGNGDGSFGAPTTNSTSNLYSGSFYDLNGDGVLDYAAADQATGKLRVYIGNGNGTFLASVSYAGSGTKNTVVGDFNFDAIPDIAVAVGGGSPGAYIYFGNGDGSFNAFASYSSSGAINAISIADMNSDGINDLLGASSPTYGARVLYGNADGSFGAGTTIAGTLTSTLYKALGADLNEDGAIDLVTIQSGNFTVNLANTTESSTIPRLNLTTQSTALDAISTIDSAMTRVSLELGSVGSSQSRYASALGVLRAQTENYNAAYSRIMDVDVAEESASMIKNQILNQAAVAVLAQAKLMPELALNLLR